MEKKNKRVLVACEESQAVTAKLRAMGIEAYSCDILPTSGDHPEWHLQQDVIPLLGEQWDAIIAFPPCTDLAVSGARHFERKRADGSQQRSIDFFMRFANHNCPLVMIENPIGIMSTVWRKPDQIIQPWMFGHPESKSTCLWLKGFPKLEQANNVKDVFDTLPAKLKNRIHYMSPGKDRARLRSKTFDGIADAIANQYGNYILNYGKEL